MSFSSPLVHLAKRVSTVLEPRFGRELAQDRAANMVTGVACNLYCKLDHDEIEEGVRGSIERFREAHCGGFDLSDNEISELTHDTLVIIFEELPLIKE